MGGTLLPCLVSKTIIQKISGGFFLLFFSLSSSLLFAQTTITGKVAVGDTALEGVTVQVKGTNVATRTNTAGLFSINAPSNGTLVFTFIGYASQEVPVNGRTTVDVQMQSANQQLTDVVVVGYTTQRRATVTGEILQTIVTRYIYGRSFPSSFFCGN